ALARHAVRLCLLQPSGRRLPRRMAGRRAVRAYRLLRRGLVALNPARPPVGGDQFADRRAAGGATGAGLTTEPPAASARSRLQFLAPVAFRSRLRAGGGSRPII